MVPSACVMYWIEKHFGLGVNLARVIKNPVGSCPTRPTHCNNPLKIAQPN